MQRVHIWSLWLMVLCSSVCGAMEQGTGKRTPKVIEEAVELCRALLAGQAVAMDRIAQVKALVQVKASARGSGERQKCQAISQTMLDLITLLEQPRGTISVALLSTMPSVPRFLGSNKSVRANFLMQLSAIKEHAQAALAAPQSVTGSGVGGELGGAAESSISGGSRDNATPPTDVALQSTPELAAYPAQQDNRLIQAPRRVSETNLLLLQGAPSGQVVATSTEELATTSVRSQRMQVVLTTATAIAALLVLDVFLRNEEALLVRFCGALRQGSKYVLDCISLLLGASVNGNVVKEAGSGDQLAYEECCVVAAELLQEEAAGHEAV